MHALSVTGLNKSYGSFEVIKDLNLQIERGSIHGLVGLNGSGKTTTIECILGLQAFNAGEIRVLGHTPDQLHQARGKLVAIFDSASLHPNLSVRQCLNQARLLCEKPVRCATEVEQLLGIARFSNFKIKHLSLGNKRRASIAHALIGQPEIIVLDEPFNGLDAEGVDDVLQLITTLNKEEGTAFLLSSHQLPYLEQICSHIAILHKGSIAVSDTVASLLAQSSTTVLLKTGCIEQALAVIEQTDKVKLLSRDEADYLQLSIDEIDSATLNRLLVEQQIPVSEMILKRASLASLFREITSEAAT
ncbi:MAG: ABC transporter ATP-binding protein [Pseudohongiella sp.]|nr:ABC transporter ATP-binding protein [Pseudohongiella sp.]